MSLFSGHRFLTVAQYGFSSFLSLVDPGQPPRFAPSIPLMAFPEPCLLTETENTIIDDIQGLLYKNGLTAHQSMN